VGAAAAASIDVVVGSSTAAVGRSRVDDRVTAVTIAPLAGADPRYAALALVVPAFSVIGWSPVSAS
jgi:hypothetical protein